MKQYDSNKEKIKAEMSIFWSRIGEILPKSRERSAIGDHTIFEAVYEAYCEFRPHLLSSLLDSVIREIEDKKTGMTIEEKYWSDSMCGWNQAIDKAIAILNKIKNG